MKKILSLLMVFFMNPILSSSVSACNNLKIYPSVYNYHITEGTSKNIFTQVYSNLLAKAKNKNTIIDRLENDKKLKINIYLINKDSKIIELYNNDDQYNVSNNSLLKIFICIKPFDSYFLEKYWNISMYYVMVEK